MSEQTSVTSVVPARKVGKVAKVGPSKADLKAQAIAAKAAAKDKAASAKAKEKAAAQAAAAKVAAAAAKVKAAELKAQIKTLKLGVKEADDQVKAATRQQTTARGALQAAQAKLEKLGG